MTTWKLLNVIWFKLHSLQLLSVSEITAQVHFLCHVINSKLKVHVAPSTKKNIPMCFIRSQKFNIEYKWLIQKILSKNFNLSSPLVYWSIAFHLILCTNQIFFYVFISGTAAGKSMWKRIRMKVRGEIWSLKIFDAIWNECEFDSVSIGKPLGSGNIHWHKKYKSQRTVRGEDEDKEFNLSRQDCISL